jgi:membrane protease YdiL (CAAX protease family)
MRMRRGVAWAFVALVVVGALVVSLTASVARGDTVFGLASWSIYLLCVALGTGATWLGLRVRRRVIRNCAITSSRAVLAASLLVAVVAFPVKTTWETDLEGRAHGLVPAAQALAFVAWPRSDWGAGDRPRDPVVGYGYTCCG